MGNASGKLSKKEGLAGSVNLEGLDVEFALRFGWHDANNKDEALNNYMTVVNKYNADQVNLYKNMSVAEALHDSWVVARMGKEDLMPKSYVTADKDGYVRVNSMYYLRIRILHSGLHDTTFTISMVIGHNSDGSPVWVPMWVDKNDNETAKATLKSYNGTINNPIFLKHGRFPDYSNVFSFYQSQLHHFFFARTFDQNGIGTPINLQNETWWDFYTKGPVYLCTSCTGRVLTVPNANRNETLRGWNMSDPAKWRPLSYMQFFIIKDRGGAFYNKYLQMIDFFDERANCTLKKTGLYNFTDHAKYIFDGFNYFDGKENENMAITPFIEERLCKRWGIFGQTKDSVFESRYSDQLVTKYCANPNNYSKPICGCSKPALDAAFDKLKNPELADLREQIVYRPSCWSSHGCYPSTAYMLPDVRDNSPCNINYCKQDFKLAGSTNELANVQLKQDCTYNQTSTSNTTYNTGTNTGTSTASDPGTSNTTTSSGNGSTTTSNTTSSSGNGSTTTSNTTSSSGNGSTTTSTSGGNGSTTTSNTTSSSGNGSTSSNTSSGNGSNSSSSSSSSTSSSEEGYSVFEYAIALFIVLLVLGIIIGVFIGFSNNRNKLENNNQPNSVQTNSS